MVELTDQLWQNLLTEVPGDPVDFLLAGDYFEERDDSRATLARALATFWKEVKEKGWKPLKYKWEHAIKGKRGEVRYSWYRVSEIAHGAVLQDPIFNNLKRDDDGDTAVNHVRLDYLSAVRAYKSLFQSWVRYKVSTGELEDKESLYDGYYLSDNG